MVAQPLTVVKKMTSKGRASAGCKRHSELGPGTAQQRDLRAIRSSDAQWIKLIVIMALRRDDKVLNNGLEVIHGDQPV